MLLAFMASHRASGLVEFFADGTLDGLLRKVGVLNVVQILLSVLVFVSTFFTLIAFGGMFLFMVLQA